MKVLAYALFFVVAFVSASLFVFWLAVRPLRIMIPGSPREYKLPAEEVTLRSDEGLRLAAWFVPRPGAPAVILLHGYPAEKADMLPLAAALSERFAVLLPDLRYFGGSEGRATTSCGDLRRADFLHERGFTRVGVFGFSLGGAIALTTAAETRGSAPSSPTRPSPISRRSRATSTRSSGS